MSSSLKSIIQDSSGHHVEECLIQQLTKVFKEKIPYSKHLEVLGILSYTSDDNTEKFVKIDFSSTAPVISSEPTSHSQHSQDENPTEDADCVPSPAQNGEETKEIDDQKSPFRNDASPPLLPPSIIQQSRCAPVIKSEENNDLSVLADSSLSGEDSIDRINTRLNRRDRRKCRQPKRQIVNSDTHTSDSEADDPTPVEETDPLLNQSKRARLDLPNACEHSSADDLGSMSVSTVSLLEIPVTSSATYVVSSSVSTISTPSAAPVSVSSASQMTLTKCLSTPLISSEHIISSVSPSVPGSRYTISAKSLGLNDLGELCSILPLNGLLSRNVLSNVEPTSISTKFCPVVTTANNPVLLTNSDTFSHVCPNGLFNNQGSTFVTSSCGSQSFLINPSLAAAVAAALSTSSVSVPIVASQINSENSPTTGIQTFSAPSIALTGPSGEILGTIPIGSGNFAHNISGSNTGIGNPQFSSASNNSGVSIPLNSGFNSSSNLTNTLNWLRCATASTEFTSQQVNSNLLPISSNCSPFSTSNTVSLLQSLANSQQSMYQVSGTTSSKAPSLPSVSVGPTLALIGTLGLNATSITNPCSAANLAELICTSTGTTNSNSTVLTSSTQSFSGANHSSNNAALVAAALLRSLATVKQVNNENNESSTSESSVHNLPGSLTLITNSLGSPCSSATTRPTIVSTDLTVGSLSSILAAKTIHPTNPPTAASTGEFAVTAGSLALNRGNLAAQLLSSVNHGTTRGPIMLSYPRGAGEMNVLLAPAAGSGFNSSSLSSMTALPTALSFQSLSNSQGTGVALTSPVILHTSVTTSSLSAVTTLVSATSTITSSTISMAPSSETVNSLKLCRPNVFSLTGANNKTSPSETQTNQLSDPTASAIDRILQTIKGCMNNTENRENENKIKIHTSSRKPEGTKLITSTNPSTNCPELLANVTSGDTSKTFSVKLAPVTLCLNRSSLGISSFDSVSKTTDPTKFSNLNNERIPLAPLSKDASDPDVQTSGNINKVYRCRYCGKTFNRKFCRERHERLHTGVKPYTCEICEEKFIRLEDKKRHVRSLQHFMVGRGVFTKSESLTVTSDESSLKIEPSSVLPLLAHTLQGGTQETMESAYVEPDDPIGTSDVTSVERASDCESYDVEESLDKEVPDFNSVQDLSPDTSDNKLVVSPCEEKELPASQTDDIDTESSIEEFHADPKIQLKSQHNLRNRTRTALIETQPERNNSPGSSHEVLSKISASEGIFATTLSAE